MKAILYGGANLNKLARIFPVLDNHGGHYHMSGESSNSSSVKYLEKKCPVELMERVDEEAMGAFLAADEDLSTVATDEELNEAITDEWGVKYSKDERKLLKAPYELNGTYSIRKGTKIICEEAFRWSKTIGCHFLKSLVIPDSVTNIGDYAFWGCKSLKSLVIPDSVNSIGHGAFWGCNIPNDLKQELSSRFGDKIFGN